MDEKYGVFSHEKQCFHRGKAMFFIRESNVMPPDILCDMDEYRKRQLRYFGTGFADYY